MNRASTYIISLLTVMMLIFAYACEHTQNKQIGHNSNEMASFTASIHNIEDGLDNNAVVSIEFIIKIHKDSFLIEDDKIRNYLDFKIENDFLLKSKRKEYSALKAIVHPMTDQNKRILFYLYFNVPKNEVSKLEYVQYSDNLMTKEDYLIYFEN